jgi:hypothetical protein
MMMMMNSNYNNILHYQGAREQRCWDEDDGSKNE